MHVFKLFRLNRSSLHLQCLLEFALMHACTFLAVLLLTSSLPAADKVESKSKAAKKSTGHFDPSKIEKIETSTAGSSKETKRVGEDWAEFLGPRRTGISGETGLLDKWPEDGPPILWKKKIGTGYTAPSVRGNLLVLFHRLGSEEIVEAFAADTGEWEWRYAYKTEFEDPYGYNNGPRCTPLLTKDRCYTFGAEGKLTCLDLKTGDKVWDRDTATEFKVPMAFFGVGSTPILEGNLLYVMVGGQPNSGMVAFDAKTGKTVWENVGVQNWAETGMRYQPDRKGAEKLASYSSPIVATIHGKRHLLCFMRPGLISLDPDTGTQNFSLFFRSVLRDSVNAARPIIIGDEVLLSSAYDVGAVLIKVKKDGKSFEEVWREELAMQNHWSTSIDHQGYVYGFSGRHEEGSTFRCIEFETGKVQWQLEEPDASGQADPKDGRSKHKIKYFGRGSAVLADGKFIVLGEEGLLALVEVNPKKYVELSRIKFDEMKYPSWTAPVLSRKRLYLRCESHLMCLDLAKPAAGK